MVHWVVMLSRGELDMTLLSPCISSVIKENYEKETKAVPLGNQDVIADHPRFSLVPLEWERPEGREFVSSVSLPVYRNEQCLAHDRRLLIE